MLLIGPVIGPAITVVLMGLIGQAISSGYNGFNRDRQNIGAATAGLAGPFVPGLY